MVVPLLFSTGCQQEEQVAVCQDPLIPIEVDFQITPENIEPASEVLFEAVVTHDNLPIENAQQVDFEIWEHNNSDYHHNVEATEIGEGRYTIPWTFDSEGVYYAYYHVTACEMHRMEKEMLIVGQPDVDSILEHPDQVQGIMNHEHDEHEEHHEEQEDEHHH